MENLENAGRKMQVNISNHSAIISIDFSKINFYFGIILDL